MWTVSANICLQCLQRQCFSVLSAVQTFLHTLGRSRNLAHNKEQPWLKAAAHTLLWVYGWCTSIYFFLRLFVVDWVLTATGCGSICCTCREGGWQAT